MLALFRPAIRSSRPACNSDCRTGWSRANAFAQAVGNVKQAFIAPSIDEALNTALKEQFTAKISEAYTITVKQDRYARLDELQSEALALAGDESDEGYHEKSGTDQGSA